MAGRDTTRRSNGPTQWFRYTDPRGGKTELMDADPTTPPFWYKLPPRSPVQASADQRRAMVGSSAAMSQAQRAPTWGQRNYLGSTSRMAPAPFAAPAAQGLQLPIVGPSNVPAAPVQNWQDPTSPESFRGERPWVQYEDKSWGTQYPDAIAHNGPANFANAGLPYDIAQMQQVAGMPGTNWQNPTSGVNEWGDPTTPESFRGPDPVGNYDYPGGKAPSVPGAQGAPAAPAIPKGWEQFGQQWWDKFVNTERQLTPSTRGMTTPDQYYRNPEQAAADIAWSKQFRAMTGHDPTEDDWRFHYMNGGGAKDNTALQNAAMAPSGGPYGR